MNIETMGLGAGSYPEPPEQKTRTISGTVYLSCKFEEELPDDYTEDEILDFIRDNLDIFLFNAEIDDIEF